MFTRILTCFVALLAFGETSLAGAPPAADTFFAAHHAGIAVNQPRGFEIRFKSGRTTFNPREPIEVELVFDPPDGLYEGVVTSPCVGWHLAEVVFDDQAIVAEPQRVLCPDRMEGVPGGVPGCVPGASLDGVFGPPRPKPPPRVITLTLNDWFRFDRPGTVRFFIRSAHFLGYTSRSPRQTSNVLTVTVTARDPAFERTRARAIAAELADASTPIERRRAALRELRQLASEEALPVLAPLLKPDMDYQAREVVLGAMVAVPDRRAAVEALQRELLRPGRPVDGKIVRNLASLRVLAELGVPHGQAEARHLALIAEIGRRRARVLDAAPGRLEAAFRDDLRQGGAHEGFFYTGALAAVARDFPREVTSAFLSLDPMRQRHLLRHSWRRFDAAVFRPLLRRVYTAPADGDAALGDIALLRLHALAPAEARSLARAEMRREVPRVSVSTLARIPTVVDGSLESRWRRTLEASAGEEALTAAAARLERFGTPSSASGVAHAWQRRWRELPLDASASALAFLARVDSPAALGAMRTALAGTAIDRGDDKTWEGLLLRAGRQRWFPELEDVAIGALSHADPVVRRDARELLSDRGSLRARAALEARLLARLPPEPQLAVQSVHVHDDEGLELARAITSARSWRLTEADVSAWEHRCRQSSCGNAFYHRSLRDYEPSQEVLVHGPSDDGGSPSFAIDQARVDGLDGLLAKLGQYPTGTSFFWSDLAGLHSRQNVERWTRAERAALFEQARTRAAAQGFVLTRTIRRRAIPANGSN